MYEMAEFCFYLDNTAPYKDEDGTRDVYTLIIGNWLRLASELEKVEINTWKYAGDDTEWCGSVGDWYDSNANHFTAYSTSLTRFIFVCNALEEAYRFVSHHYDKAVSQDETYKKNLLRKASMKAAFLVDQMDESELPKEFQHITNNLIVSFKKYYALHSPRLTGLRRVSESNFSYALHLTRNLRNHVTHGMFPLVENFEYFSAPPLGFYQNLFAHACRVATIYVQGLLGKYCKEFLSSDYKSNEDSYGEEFDYFLENCTIGYSRELHLKGDFRLNNWEARARSA